MRRESRLALRLMAVGTLLAFGLHLGSEPPPCATPKLMDQVRTEFDELQKLYIKSGRRLVKLADARDTGLTTTYAKALGYESSRHCEWKGTLDNGETTMVFTRVDAKGAAFKIPGFCSTLYISRYSKSPTDCKDWRGPNPH